MMKPRFGVLAGMILAAGLARLLPHPWNVTPVAAMALFGGAQFHKKSHAFLVPLLALLVSDLFLGFHATMPFVYGSMALVVLFGMALQNRKGVMPMGGAVLGGAVTFFLITNFGHWLVSPMYAKSFQGLMTSYSAAIPFFRNSLLGDVFFVALLFGSFHFAERRIPALQRTALTLA